MIVSERIWLTIMAAAEHVFEGQISMFFSSWLNQGTFWHQNPPVANPQPKVPCSITLKYILKVPHGKPDAWKLDGKLAPFIDLMLAELGNQHTLDRLTIFKSQAQQEERKCK